MTKHYDKMLLAIFDKESGPHLPYPVSRALFPPPVPLEDVALFIRQSDFNSMLGAVEKLLHVEGAPYNESIRREISDELYLLTQVSFYEAWMKKKYVFSENICWKLANTTVKDITYGALRSPFKSVGFDFPSHIMPHPAGGWLTSAYIYFDKGAFCVLLIAGDGQSADHDDMWKFIVIDPNPGQSIEEAVLSTQEKARGAFPDINAEDTFVQSWNGAKRQLLFIINCMLYITSHKADVSLVSPASTRSKKPKKVRAAMASPFYEVGATIVLSPEEKRRYISSATGDGKGLDVSFMVSGHWRHQFFGTGRTERKLIWIEPFWKGDLRRVISSPHLVK